MTDSLARRLMRDLLGAPSTAGPELVIETGPAAGQRLQLPGVGSRIVIGRGEHAGWIVLDPDLSRAHAAIDRRDSGVWLVDLGSKNGTKLDGRHAPVEEPGLAVPDGALIAIGNTTIRYRDPAAGVALDTRTSAERPPAAAATVVPPRWPIVAAALVAVAAIVVVIALVVTG